MKMWLEHEEMLPVVNELMHISPSSLKTYLNCPHKFYQLKIGENKEQIKKKRTPQSLSAAFGSAFDSFIKAFISHDLDMETKYDAEELLVEEIPDPKTRGRVRDHARIAFDLYLDTAYESLKADGIASIDFHPTVKLGEATVLGKVDLLRPGSKMLDWKCRGYLASSKSPHPGWLRKWSYNKKFMSFFESDEPHKRFEDNLEDVNLMWAIQLIIYAFLAGHKPGEPVEVAVDEVTMRNVKTPSQFDKRKLVVSQLRMGVSPKFQNEVFWLLQEVWARSKTGRFPLAEPAKRRCMSFGELCPASDYCQAYKVSQNPTGDDAFDQLNKLLG